MENIHRDDLDIVYINLDKSTERKTGMERKLSQFFKPADFKRFPAIQGDHRDAKISPNALGCFLSHLEVIKSSSPNHPTLILEDDVLLCKNFNTYLKNLIKGLHKISPEWDILFLAQMTFIGQVYKTVRLLKIKKTIPKGTFRILNAKTNYAASTSAYIINPLSKGKILNLLKKNVENAYALPIDLFFKKTIDDNSLNSKFVFPYLTGLEGLDTTIQNTTDKQIKSSRLSEDQLNLFFVDSNPSDLMKKYLDESFIKNNQDAYLASLILFNWFALDRP